MIQDAKVICDGFRQEIPFGGGRPYVRVLVELVKDGSDRHYCENCIDKAINPSGGLIARHDPAP